MTRKLVTIRTVSAVDPIPNADSIERITVDGWELVSGKGNFTVNDTAVYFEIDSFLPTGDARWQDLVSRSSRTYNGIVGHRLRTVKLRGQVSQGFAIPLREFPEILQYLQDNFQDMTYDEWVPAISEVDFAELLGVVKWEPPMPAELAGVARGNFPSFIRKTDQERIQNRKRVLSDNDVDYERSLKLDGSSETVYHNNGVSGVCSRNLDLVLDESNSHNTFIKLARESGLLDAVTNSGRNIAVQAELCGEGIQGNREQIKGHKLFVFDVFDIDTQEYIAPAERRELVAELLKSCDGKLIQHIPVLDENFRIPAGATVQDMIALADGPSLVHPIREGDVYKRNDGTGSFKAISNRFLLKEKD